MHKPLGGEVKCMDVSPILEGRAGAPFLAVGMADASVRIFSLGAEDMLEPRATQVSRQAEFQPGHGLVCIQDMTEACRCVC